MQQDEKHSNNSRVAKSWAAAKEDLLKRNSYSAETKESAYLQGPQIHKELQQDPLTCTAYP